MTAGSDLPAFDVSVRRAPDGVVVRIEGELDVATAPRLATTLDRVIDERPRRLLVDASLLEFADVAGLAPLIRAAEELPARAVEVRNAGRQLRRVLGLLGLTELLPVRD